MNTEIRSTDAPVDDPYGEEAQARLLADEQRERDWAWLEADMRDFKAKYGVPMLVRVLASAVNEQRELLRA